jgi:acyl carrier protein
MQQNDIQATVTRVLREVAKVDPAVVARDKRLREDLGLDSLTLIEVAVAAEDAFGVPLPDEDLEHFQTVGDLIDYVQQSESQLVT